MDTSKLGLPDFLVAGGGLAVIVFGLLKWFDVPSQVSANAFHFSLTGLIPWIFVLAATGLTVAKALGVFDRSTAPWALIILALAAIAALLILIRLVFGASASDFVTLDGAPDYKISRTAPIYLATLGAIVAAGGAFLNFQSDVNERARSRRRR